MNSFYPDQILNQCIHAHALCCESFAVHHMQRQWTTPGCHMNLDDEGSLKINLSLALLSHFKFAIICAHRKPSKNYIRIHTRIHLHTLHKRSPSSHHEAHSYTESDICSLIDPFSFKLQLHQRIPQFCLNLNHITTVEVCQQQLCTMSSQGISTIHS